MRTARCGQSAERQGENDMPRAIHWLVTVTACLLLAGCEHFPARDAAPPDARHLVRLVETVQPAVVTVVTQNVGRAAAGIGSGFFINSMGHLVTNYHVMAGAYAAQVKTADGQTYPVERVLSENRARDLVLLQVAIPAEARHWVQVAATEPTIAERVVVVGSPLGLERTVSEGIVSAVRELPGVGRVFQLSAPISQGSSGGPVVNFNGEVVGVVSFQSVEGQNLNFAIAGRAILELPTLTRGQTVAEWTHTKLRQTPGLAGELCRRGFDFMVRGEYGDALGFYQEAVAASPADAEAWRGLGACYAGLEKPAAAIAAYRNAIRTAPTDPAVRMHLGLYLHRIDRLDDALAVYREVLALDPDHLDAHYASGVIYERLQAHEKQRRAFMEVLRLQPRHPLALLRLGRALQRLERHAEAIAVLDRAVRIAPGLAPAHVERGRAHAALDEPGKAYAAYREAIRVDPDFAPAHFHLGLSMLVQGDRTAALEQYKILKRLDPKLATELFDRIYAPG